MRFSFTVSVSVSGGVATVSWATFDANSNQLATGTAATLALAATAAVVSLKASVSTQATALSGVS